MHYLELQALAELRIAEAKELLNANFPRGSCYLAGYAVEAGIKAIIAKNFGQYTVPKLKAVEDFYTHEFEKLISLEKLSAELKKNEKIRYLILAVLSLVSGLRMHGTQ
jgi:HEPN domain-containing protein